MKVSLFLICAISVSVAQISHPIHGFSTNQNLIERGEEPGEDGRGEPEVRPRPVIANPPPRDGNPNEPSVPEVADTAPKYQYEKDPVVEEEAGTKEPEFGETIFENPLDALPGLAKMYLGLDDEAYAKAISSDGFITAAKEGRQYTARSSPETSYNRQRAIGKEEYLAAVKDFGMDPVLPPTWEQDNGWWRGKAVDLQYEVTMRRYRQTMALRQALLKNPERLRLELIDNTGPNPPALKGRRAESSDAPSRPPPRPVDGGPLGQTLLEIPSTSKSSKSSNQMKREDPITAITSTVNNPTNNTASQSASFQLYLSAFSTAQSNTSSILFPILDQMLNGTNSSIVYDAAWSIYSDLTGSSPIIIGPFLYGMHCLDWIEDQLFGTSPNISAMSANDQFARNKILAFHSVLLDMYYYAWDNALAAMNKTGLVDDMTTLAGYMATNDTAIIGAYANYKSPAYDSKYFTIYNETLLPDSAYKNLTS